MGRGVKPPKIEVIRGLARDVTARVLVATPMAVVVSIDTNTKYTEPVLTYEEIRRGSKVVRVLEVMLCRQEVTLRWDRRYKRPSVVRFALPKCTDRDRWWHAVETCRYGCVVLAVLQPGGNA